MYICSLAPWTINIAFMPFGKYYWPVKVILQVFLWLQLYVFLEELINDIEVEGQLVCLAWFGSVITHI